MKPADAKLAQAAYEAEQAKQRLVNTASALQYRLKPATIAGNAWEGMRERGEEIAGDAIQAVKERPGKVSGVVAGVGLFLARHTIKSVFRSLFGRRNKDHVTTKIDEHDQNYDLTAPAVKWSQKEGVSA